MYNQQNAIAAIRVSTMKQGIQGDSPEAQREQIQRFAKSKNIRIKKVFAFMESASKEQQPMQQAINYCKDSKHHVQLFIVKSIDRFTRGGSYSYSSLKLQLEKCDVRLVDIYGIIGTQRVNTLEHLGVSYKWSVYDPTKNSEILEAERASDEKREIMSRMVGAEIRYVRLGYWVRRAPFGFINRTVETMHGSRCVLEPDVKASPWIAKMFELRCRGTLDDQQIVEEVNKLGFKSRVTFIRSRHNRTKIIGKRGGDKLTVKGLRRYIRKSIYAGVNNETWLLGQTIRCKFDGLVSIETFNKANRGKVTIVEKDGELKFQEFKDLRKTHKSKDNPLYPYKRVVMCPGCGLPLYGSASRGKQGKYYPAYHCDKRKAVRNHYFRVPKQKFDQTITEFVQGIHIAPKYREPLVKAVLVEWKKRQQEQRRDIQSRNLMIKELVIQAEALASNIKFGSEITLKYIERDLVRIEGQIAEHKAENAQLKADEITSRQTVTKYARYFTDHPDSLLFDQPDPVQRANYFGLLFNRAPTYHELVTGEHQRGGDILSSLFER